MPNLEDNKAGFIIKTHHCMMDGQAFGAFYARLCGEKDGSNLPGLRPFPWYKWLVIYLFMPLSVAILGLKWITASWDYNALKKSQVISPNKKGAASMDMDIRQIKS